MRGLRATGAIAVAMLLAGCAGTGVPPAAEANSTKSATTFSYASGLKYVDTKVGGGTFPSRGQVCVVHYTGWLYQNGKKGAKFDSSVDRGQPFEFPLGQGRVIRGWDEGVATMKVGGRRTLIIQPDLAYGEGGGNGIPPLSTLIFDVELLAIKG